MNKNCPHMKINLEMGFLNLNRCNMTWHNMMHLMQSIASKEGRKKLLYRQATVNARTTVLGTRDRRTKRKGSDVVPLIEQVDNITILSGATILLIKE